MDESEQKLVSLLKSCFFSNEFPKTQKSLKMLVVLPTLTWSYFKFFNFFHPLKNAIIWSTLIGCAANVFIAFSREIFSVCETQSELAAKLRLYHQNASYSNIFIPYFKHETIKAEKLKEKTQDVSNSNN